MSSFHCYVGSLLGFHGNPDGTINPNSQGLLRMAMKAGIKSRAQLSQCAIALQMLGWFCNDVQYCKLYSSTPIETGTFATPFLPTITIHFSAGLHEMRRSEGSDVSGLGCFLRPVLCACHLAGNLAVSSCHSNAATDEFRLNYINVSFIFFNPKIVLN